MKKNVIFLVIDALLYNKLGFARNDMKVSPTPYIDELANRGICATQMFSQAPFTEAAIIALLGSSNTMENGGYLKKLKHVPKTILDVFKEHGYDTFHQLQPHIYTSTLINSLTDWYYSVCFDIEALWNYRLNYYFDLYKANSLDEEDIETLIDFINENLVEWIRFLESVINKDESISLILDNISEFNPEIQLDLVSSEYSRFLKSKEEYVKEILELGHSHVLFSSKSPIQKKINNKEFKEKIVNKYKDFIQESYWLNFRKNLTNNGLKLKYITQLIDETIKNKFSKETRNYLIRYFYNYFKKTLLDKDLYDRISMDYDLFKAGPGLKKHFDHFLDWTRKRENKDNPFFAYIHVDDIHTPEMFFTYDVCDEAIIDEEMNLLKEFKNKLPQNYKGSLSYDYSMVYIDNCIKRIVSALENEDILKDTYFVITSDHGFSFTYDPVRCNFVNNFFDENYHIPFIAIGEDIRPMKVESLSSSIDIAPTILELCGIDIPESFNGKSLLSDLGSREYVTMEYMGQGCPDIKRRPIQYAIRSNKYKLVYSAQLSEEFSYGKLLETYDLIKDPSELINIKDNIDNIEEINILLVFLEKRHCELRKKILSSN